MGEADLRSNELSRHTSPQNSDIQSASDWFSDTAANASAAEHSSRADGSPRATDFPTRKLLRRASTAPLPDVANHETAPPLILTNNLRADPHPWEWAVAPVAGMLAGGLEISCTWPMEWAKVQSQLHRSDPNWTLLSQARRTGLGMYKGLPPMLIGAPLQGAVRFTTLERIKRALAEPGSAPGPGVNLLAGVLSGCLEAALVVTPIETIKTRLVDANKGLLRGTVDFVVKEGLSGIYRGLVPTVFKSASNQALRFVIFGEYKRRLSAGTPAFEMSPSQALAGGMLAGTIGSFITMPFDVVKTRMQGLEASRYTGALNCALTIIRTEGVRCLFKGLGARLGRSVPGQGIIFGSYELISQGVHRLLLQWPGKECGR
mmetsp:Transcript_26825/g.58934  ORF Transcript_26825/g.58934 Transcript_26825/m.58934 type:complete len:374 (-) Transcript_26825:254-1375(-)